MLKVLSLFDGMSCGAIALHELGVPVKYYASEIDQHATKQTKLNFPDTVHLGDVVLLKKAMCWKDSTYKLAISSKYISQKLKDKITFLRFIDWSSINLVLAGSPCQGFSFAGKQLAFNDPRSKLFFVFVEILNHIKKLNPDVKFLLENVNMKKSHLRVISEYVGVFPVNINSNLVSAQNRDRWYWTNIRTKKVGLFDELYVDIPQPKDKGMLLKDILQSDVDEKYFLSDKMINHFTSKPGDFGQRFNPHTDIEIKGNCLNASTAKMVVTDNYIVAMRGRNPDNPSDRTTGSPTEQRLEPKTDGKTNCLTSVAKDNLVMTKNYAQWDTSGKGYKSQQDRAFYEDGKMGCIPSARTENKINVLTNSRIRRLTPTECARLQTIPEWYKWECSDTQIYRMCGNGWTCAVIQWILSFGNFKSINQYEQTKH